MYAYIRGNEKNICPVELGKNTGKTENLEWIKSHILSYAIHTEFIFFSKIHHLHNVEFLTFQEEKILLKLHCDPQLCVHMLYE